MKPFVLTDNAKMAEAMVRMQQAGEGYRLPLVRAAAAAHLAAAAVTHGQPAPARYLSHDRSTAITICDDHPDATGPAGWKQIRRLMR